jgi:hypothetical protein
MSGSHKPVVKILVACHKPSTTIRQDDIFMPIQVGKDLHPEIDLGFQCDNTGENISRKNASYCELTALYWAWKNLKNVDYSGLCHYRRYFDFKTIGGRMRYITGEEFEHCKDIDLPQDILSPDKVILQPFASLQTDVWHNFQKTVLAQDMYILYKVIEKYTPDYLPTFERYMLGNRKAACNMFVMPWGEFDKYCQWLFRVLALCEERIKESPYISYKRVFGYFGESLLPIYCLHNHLKIEPHRCVACVPQAIKVSPLKNFIAESLGALSFQLTNYRRHKTLKDSYWELYLKLDGIDI